MSVALYGYRKREPDPPQIMLAKAEHKRLTDEHAALLEKVLIQKKFVMSIEKRLRRGTQADIEREKAIMAELEPRLEEAEYALRSCAISRLLKNEITREQIISGEIPPYVPPVSKEENFGDVPADWIKANCKKWERGSKRRYYFKTPHVILEKAGISYKSDEEGRIISVNGGKVPNLSCIYFDPIEGRFNMNRNRDCGWILERLKQAFESQAPRM